MPLLHRLSFLTTILALTLAACQFGETASLPPQPTIAPAKATPTAAAQPAATTAEQAPPTPPPSIPESPGATSEAAAAGASPTPTPTAVLTPPPPATTTSLPTQTPPPPEETVPPPPLEALTIRLEPVASGFTEPLYVTHAGDGSGRLFVVEQAGRIFILTAGQVNPTPFLDITPLVGSDGNEQGLLGLAFHPEYEDNGYFFVYYTDKNGDVVIARYQLSANPDRADPASAQTLLTVGQPFANHNGGQLVFGPDGYLYAGLGDGGAAGDPQNNGQSLDTLLGKILRLDVDQGTPYGAPETNPFANSDGDRPEIWSYGWRNPWRFSFDRATGDLYIADVGQNQFEEVNVEPAGSSGGQNYGWRLMEGFHCFAAADCDPAGQALVLPVTEYDHSQGCSVTGGYVYRGRQSPALTGVYLYGDFCSGTIWGLRREADGGWSEAELLQTGHTISSFGQSETGELYLTDHSQGDILQIRAE